MSINDTIIDQMYYKAKNSLMEKQLSACLIQNGKIISNIFCNSYNSEFDNHNSHAETNVILNFYRKERKPNKKISIIAIRLNKNNQLCNARPCFHCLKLIKDVGIRKTFYSTDNKNIVSERVRYMISTHLSSGYISNLNVNKQYFLEKNIYKNFPLLIKYQNLIMFFSNNKNNINNIKVTAIDEDFYIIDLINH